MSDHHHHSTNKRRLSRKADLARKGGKGMCAMDGADTCAVNGLNVKVICGTLWRCLPLTADRIH